MKINIRQLSADESRAHYEGLRRFGSRLVWQKGWATLFLWRGIGESTWRALHADDMEQALWLIGQKMGATSVSVVQ